VSIVLLAGRGEQVLSPGYYRKGS